MTADRYPTSQEFFERLEVREVEEDLKQELTSRLQRESQPVSLVGEDSTVVAVASRLLPGDVPGRALAVFVDQVFDKQLGRGDDPDGLMPRSQHTPAGFKVIDDEARKRHGAAFAALSGDQQDALLQTAEKGDLQGPEGWDCATWFKRVRQLLILGFGSDPRGMVQMGFPGPSYKPGHLWLGKSGIQARADRRKGYMEL